MTFTWAKFKDVSAGVQEGQFGIGDRVEVSSLDELDPIYRHLMDEPVTAVLAVMGSDGRPNLTPVWFGYSGDKVILNFAEHRKKTAWMRRDPRITIMLMNPQNPYHWMSIKATVTNEVHEDDPHEGHRATKTIDEAWSKYTGAEPPYGLRDPSINERRVLFECKVDRVATFGKPS